MTTSMKLAFVDSVTKDASRGAAQRATRDATHGFNHYGINAAIVDPIATAVATASFYLHHDEMYIVVSALRMELP